MLGGPVDSMAPAAIAMARRRLSAKLPAEATTWAWILEVRLSSS